MISLTLTGAPDAPIAVADSYSLMQDTTFFVPVMNNDSDIDSVSGLLSLTGNTNPANGILSPTATGYLYTPNL